VAWEPTLDNPPRAPFVIAVDGPAASGKGTVAARLAREGGLPYLDTGLLYRAVGVILAELGGSTADADAAAQVARTLDAARLDDERFRTRAASEAASQVAVHPSVRQALLDLQRAFAAQPGGAVLDGRDIGTVIAPHAPAKLFVTASPEVRADRRLKQLAGQGESVAYEDVLADIRIRDERDAGRSAAPLAQAKDAVLLDTSEMTIEQAADAARRIVEAARTHWNSQG
jgi:cytidylate kinase